MLVLVIEVICKSRMGKTQFIPWNKYKWFIDI